MVWMATAVPDGEEGWRTIIRFGPQTMDTKFAFGTEVRTRNQIIWWELECLQTQKLQD